MAKIPEIGKTMVQPNTALKNSIASAGSVLKAEATCPSLGIPKTMPIGVNFQRFPTLDAKKLVNAPKMSAHHRGICHF